MPGSSAARSLGPGVAVFRKFRDDDGNALAVALAWYGFVAISPLLLLVVTIFGFIGADSLGDKVVSTLQQFPVIGSGFTTGEGASNLHGSGLGLLIGAIGLLYGAMGVTRTGQRTIARVWGVPPERQARLRGEARARPGRTVGDRRRVPRDRVRERHRDRHRPQLRRARDRAGRRWSSRTSCFYLLSFLVLAPPGTVVVAGARARLGPGRRGLHAAHDARHRPRAAPAQAHVRHLRRVRVGDRHRDVSPVARDADGLRRRAERRAGPRLWPRSLLREPQAAA